VSSPSQPLVHRWRATGAGLPGLGRSVAVTALLNVATAFAAGIAGAVIARSLGPADRGHYGAVLAWFGLVLSVGQLGQTAATTYFVARDPARAADYVATSRTIMLLSGGLTLTAGLVAAPLLASGQAATTFGHRLMFATCLACFAGAGYTFALQATHLTRWNLVRNSQALAYLAAVVLLAAIGGLGLRSVLTALSVTMAAQTLFAYWLCSRSGLTGGRCRLALARPMTRYGLGQLAASLPGVVTARLDQLVLSLTTPSATLGRYVVALSLAGLAAPVVSAFGSTAFPRLASRLLSPSGTRRLQRWAVLTSTGVGVAGMGTVMVAAPWMVPAVFGSGFRDAVPLVWLLAPGGAFLACGQVCADLLGGHGRPLAVARAQAIAAAVMITGLATLLPAFGAPGAAITSSAAAAVALLHMVASLRRISQDPAPVPIPTAGSDPVPPQPGLR
jgi:O-antigen/teichoic acid export membrane protein